MKNNSDNFLDYVYMVTEGLTWTISSSGEVIVQMDNKGFANRVAQLIFHKPKQSQISLEGIGSFIFKCIDGKRTVYDIGQLVHEKYQDEAEPLYERLSIYIKQLENLGFVTKKL